MNRFVAHRSVVSRLALVFLFLGAASGASDTISLRAFATSSAGDTPRSIMPANTAKIWIIFQTKGIRPGDKLRATLIADKAGHIAPENSKITEAKATLDGDTANGGISFSRPINDWPIGDYHVDIYVNDLLMTSVRFAIEAAR